jgi:hypothetical protein
MTAATHHFKVGDIVQPMGRNHRYKVVSASRSWVWVGNAEETEEQVDRPGKDGPIAFQARDVELVEPTLTV